MGEIVSLKNDRVRRVQALQRSTRRRYQEGLLVIEGLRLMREALAAPAVMVREVFHTRAFAEGAAGVAVLAEVARRGVAVWETPPEVLAAMSDTETPQGILALVAMPEWCVAPSPASEGAPLVLLPDGVRDPGNLGTMLRTAWAAGTWQVWLPPGAVDLTNPKVLRAGMGAHFHLPLAQLTWDEVRARLAGLTVWIAEANRGTPYHALPWREPLALIIGGEAAGAGAELRGLPGARYVHIPMAAGVESLNAAVAAAVLLFEAARGRSAAGVAGELA